MTVMLLKDYSEKIHANEVVQKVKDCGRYDDYDGKELKKIIDDVLLVGSEYVASLEIGNDGVHYNDEEAFDYILDYMLKEIGDIKESADIAKLVDDVVYYFQEMLEEKGLLVYSETAETA